jgi:hypothetical protein
MAENYYNSTLTAAQIEAVLAGVNGVTGLVKRKADGTFEAGTDVFWATYGVTTSAELEAAYQSGAIVAMKATPATYNFFSITVLMTGRSSATHHYFVGFTGYKHIVFSFDCSNDVWSKWDVVLEQTSQKQTSLSGDSTDSQYPSAKCVYDALLLKQNVLTFDDAPTADSANPVKSGGVKVALDLKAPLESPALTGMPTAPTAAEGTDNTQIATTAFAKAVAESKAADVAALVSVASAADVQAVLEV